MSTMKEIAKRAGVSIPTVSRILNGKYKENWPSIAAKAKHIRQIADELQFRPNASARSIVTQRTHQVGVLIRNVPVGNYRMTDLVQFEYMLGMDDEFQAAQYLLSIVRYDDVANDFHQSRAFQERLLEGTVLLGGIPQQAKERMRLVSPAQVWLNPHDFQPEYCVSPDDYHAGCMVGEMIAAAGYRQAIWVMPRYGEMHISAVQRERGVTETLTRHGVKIASIPTHPNVQLTDPDPFIKKLKPDVAFVCMQAGTAARVASVANTLGYCFGRDYGLTSCDMDFRHYKSLPDISGVLYDRYEMGQMAARMLISRIENPSAVCPSVRVKGRWVAGSSLPGPDFAHKIGSTK